MKRVNIKLLLFCVLTVICFTLSSCGMTENASSGSTAEEIPTTAQLSTAPQASQTETAPYTTEKTGKKDKKSALLIAHRGYMGQYPESTIQAFEGAFSSGFDGIECDVWETRNGDLLIQHDPTTTRTTGKKKYIWNLSKKKRTDYPIVKGDNVERYNSTKLIIPTLDEVLKTVQKNSGYLWLHIKDIKNDKKYRLSKSGEKKILSLLKKYNLNKKTLIFGGKSYVKPFVKKGFKTGVFTSPKKKKQLYPLAKWCKKTGVNTFVFANMRNLRLCGGGKYISKYLKKKKLDFGVYKTSTEKSYRYLCRIGAYFSMSNFDIR